MKNRKTTRTESQRYRDEMQSKFESVFNLSKHSYEVTYDDVAFFIKLHDTVTGYCVDKELIREFGLPTQD